MKMRTSMKSSMKVSSCQANEIHVSSNYVIRTKKDHLSIVMKDWEQRLIVMSNYDANDLGKSGMMRLGKLCRAEAIIPLFFFAREPKCMDASVMYSSSNIFRIAS